MASANPLTKPSLLLFSFITFLSLSNSVLGAGHHKHKHAQAPAPSLVMATPPAPVEATPALVEAPSPAYDLAPAEGPSEDDYCQAYIPGLIECLAYIEAGSSSATPGASCCSALRTMANADATCLCSLLMSDSQDPEIPMNASRIMSLPCTCSFTLPTTGKCNALLGPSTIAAAPVPSGSQGSAVASPPVPAESFAVALPITIVTIVSGIAVSVLSLIV